MQLHQSRNADRQRSVFHTDFGKLIYIASNACACRRFELAALAGCNDCSVNLVNALQGSGFIFDWWMKICLRHRVQPTQTAWDNQGL